MIDQSFVWKGKDITFRSGESIAAALEAAGIFSFGADTFGQDFRYFCGIGACQGCLVRVDGLLQEACLTAARPGMRVESPEEGHD